MRILTTFLCIVLVNGLWGQSTTIKRHAAIVSQGDDVFVRAACSKHDFYAGECFFVEYLLYHSVSVIDPQWDTEVYFEHCFQESCPTDQRQYTETIGKRTYNVVLLRKYLVIAENPGKLIIPGLRASVKISDQTGSGFFGQDAMVTKDLRGQSTSVFIKPLPGPSDPVLFSGAVGDLKMSGSYKLSERNQAMLEFKMTISGKGNIRAARFKMPRFPDGLEVYNIRDSRKDSITGEGIVTHVSYTFEVVGNYRGDYSIPPFAFTFFDPVSNRYRRLCSDSLNWKVNIGPVRSELAGTKDHRSESIQLKRELDLAPEITDAYTGWYLFLFTALTVLFIIRVKGGHIVAFVAKLIEKVRLRLARRFALKSIQRIISVAADLDQNTFYEQLNAIFYKYIREKDVGIDELSFENDLHLQSLPLSAIDQIGSFVSHRNRARFGCSEFSQRDRLQSCSHLINVINSIAKYWDV